MSTVEVKTVEALLQRGRTRMVQAYVNEGGLIDPQKMHTYWRGFAQCAAALLNGAAQVMASNDQATEPERVVQAAFAALPDDLERLTLADMKRHMWAKGVDFGSELITDRKVDAVEQLKHGVGVAVEFNNEHAVAAIDVQDGCLVHMDSHGVVSTIVAQGGAA
jgi:hypothetical protein